MTEPLRRLQLQASDLEDRIMRMQAKLTELRAAISEIIAPRKRAHVLEPPLPPAEAPPRRRMSVEAGPVARTRGRESEFRKAYQRGDKLADMARAFGLADLHQVNYVREQLGIPRRIKVTVR